MWMETSLMESPILRGPYLKSEQASDGYFKPDNAFDRLGSFSNGRPLSFMMPNASHFDFKTQSLLMLRKHARLGQYDNTALIPRPFHRLTQVYTALRHDRSAGWRKCIRLWDQDHFAGWRKATVSIPREISTKNHRSRVTGLCQQRGSENKNSTCPNLAPTCLPLIQIARLGREFPANQALQIEVDIRYGMFVIVVPEILVAANYRWHCKVSEDSRCRCRRSWPYNWRYTSS